MILHSETRPPTTATMSKQALDALTVVEAATMFGLPIPFSVSFTPYDVSASVYSYADLDAWATTLATEPTCRDLGDGTAHYTVAGTIAGASVTLHVIAEVLA